MTSAYSNMLSSVGGGSSGGAYGSMLASLGGSYGGGGGGGATPVWSPGRVGHDPHRGGGGFLSSLWHGAEDVAGGAAAVAESAGHMLVGTALPIAADVRDLGALSVLGIPQVGILRRREGHGITHLGELETWNRIVKPMGAAYAYKYGPALHGDFTGGEHGGVFHAMNEDKLGSLLDVLALGSIVFGGEGLGVRGASIAAGAGRTAEAGRLATVAGGTGVRAGLARGAAAYQRTLTTRELAVTTESGAQVRADLKAAHTPHWRGVQAIADAVSRRIPVERRLLGAWSTERRIFRTGRAEAEATAAPAEAMLRRRFSNSLRGLSGEELFAFHMIAEHTFPEERAQMLYRESDATFATRKLRATRERYRKQIETLTDKVRKIMVEGPEAHPRLAKAIQLGREASEASSNLLIEMGRLDPLQHERRVYAPARKVAGAEFTYPERIRGEVIPGNEVERSQMQKDLAAWRVAIERHGKTLAEEEGAARRLLAKIPRDRSAQMEHEMRAAVGAVNSAEDEVARQAGHHETARGLAERAQAQHEAMIARHGGRAAETLPDLARTAKAELTRARGEWDSARKALQTAKDRYHGAIHAGGGADTLIQRAERLGAATRRIEDAELAYVNAVALHQGAGAGVRELRAAQAELTAAMADEAAARRILANAELGHTRAVGELAKREGHWQRIFSEREHAQIQHARYVDERVAPARARVANARDRANTVLEGLRRTPKQRARREPDVVTDGGLQGGDLPTHEAALERSQGIIFGQMKDHMHEGWGLPFRFEHVGPKDVTAVGVGRTASGMAKIKDPLSTRVWQGVRMATGTMMTHPEVVGQDLARTIRWRTIHAFVDYARQWAVPAEFSRNGRLLEGYELFNPEGLRVPRQVKEMGGLMDAGDALEESLTDNRAHVAEVNAVMDEILPKGGLAKRHIEEHRAAGRPLAQEAHAIDALVEEGGPGAGGLLMVPKWVERSISREVRESEHVIWRYYDKFMDVWRATVLQYRPAWLVYNIVGQNMLYWLHYTGVGGMRAYIDALRAEKGDRPLATIAGKSLGPGRLGLQMRRLATELEGAEGLLQGGPTAAQLPGAFGHDRAYQMDLYGVRPGLRGGVTREGLQQAGRDVAHYANSFGRMMQWANLHIADDIPRFAAFIAETRKMPAFKEFRRNANGWTGMLGTVRELLAKAPLPQTVEKMAGARRRTDMDVWREWIRGVDPELVRKAVSQLDRNLGNFKQLSPFERQWMRRVFPFYSWFKVITVLSFRLAVDDPVRVLFIKNLEQAVAANPEMAIGGPVPQYADASAPLGRPKGGIQTMLATAGFNPFATPVQEYRALRNLGGSGELGSESIINMMGPWPPMILQAMGMDPFYGGQYKGAGKSHGLVGRTLGYFTSLPEARLAQQLAGRHPGGYPLPVIGGHLGAPERIHGYRSTLYDQPSLYYLFNYLGLPIRRLRLSEARRRALAGE